MPPSRVRQFSIRTLLLSVAAVGVLCAVGNLIGAEWMSLTLWILLLVVAHVAGAVIGHRRRAGHDAQLDPPDATHLSRGAPLPDFAASRPSELTHQQPLARWVRHLTIGGALLGACGGLIGMWLLGAASINGLVLGTLSAAVLGAFFAFLASSFLAIAANAFEEARRSEK